MEMMKSQLMVAVAKPTIEAPAAAAADPAADDHAAMSNKPLPWALRTTYETAANFVATHFEKETMRSAPVDDPAQGAVAWTANSAANAATVRITHDSKKEKVYSATLTVSLATDGPKDKLVENTQLVGEFITAFAPGMPNGAEKTARIIEQLRRRMPPSGTSSSAAIRS